MLGAILIRGEAGGDSVSVRAHSEADFERTPANAGLERDAGLRRAGSPGESGGGALSDRGLSAESLGRTQLADQSPEERARVVFGAEAVECRHVGDAVLAPEEARVVCPVQVVVLARSEAV